MFKLGLAILLTAGVLSATAPATATTPISHIVLIVDENKAYERIVGSPCCPFINGTMIANGVLATDHHAIRTGSLHDYLALTDGLTSSLNGRADNLFNQLQGMGISWRSYEETMPSPCYTGSSYGTAPDLYVIGHDPAVHYTDIASNPSACANVVPLHPALRDDLASRSLPAFSFITPNECNDMHSCSRGHGDDWLASWIPRIASAIGPDGVILLTWDEGRKALQHVPLVEYGPGVAGAGLSGTSYAATTNHYTVLAALEDNWGLPRLNNAIGATALPIP